MNRMKLNAPHNPFLTAPFPAGMTCQSLYLSEKGYPFLHDTALGVWQGRIICAWYNCAEGEMQGDTLIRARWSEDEGKTWSRQEIIASSPDPSLYYVPVSFASDERDFFAFVTRMSGLDQPEGVEIFRYTGCAWKSEAILPLPMIVNTPAYRMANGRYLLAGRMRAPGCLHPEIPAVAVSETTDVCSDYRLIPLPGPWLQGDFRLRFPETALIADGRQVTAFVRGQTFRQGENWRPYCFTSSDDGLSWSKGTQMNLPAVGSKLFGGTTSTGLSYLLFNAENTQMNQWYGRGLLAMAVSRTGTDQAERCYRLLDGPHSAGMEPEWSYPCSVEFNGHLYVACTSAKRNAALLKIPLASLEE